MKKPVKMRVKSKEELLKWFEDNGWVKNKDEIDGYDDGLPEDEAQCFQSYLFELCGEIKNFSINDEYEGFDFKVYKENQDDYWYFKKDWLLPIEEKSATSGFEKMTKAKLINELKCNDAIIIELREKISNLRECMVQHNDAYKDLEKKYEENVEYYTESASGMTGKYNLEVSKNENLTLNLESEKKYNEDYRDDNIKLRVETKTLKEKLDTLTAKWMELTIYKRGQND